MKKLFFYLLLLSPLLVSAQGKVTISGTIENGGNDSVFISIDKNYLHKNPFKIGLTVAQGLFSFEFSVERNQVVELTYQSQTFPIYVEPNDKLVLKFTAGNLPESITFSGKGGINNQFLKSFNSKFKKEYTPSLVEETIKTATIDQFEMSLFDHRAEQKKYIDSSADKKNITDDFKKYIDNQIAFNYWNYLFAFPIVNANKSTSILTVTPLPKVMTDAEDKKKANNEDAIISESYRSFLTYFVTYYASELNGFNKFKDYTPSAEKKYVIATDNLKGTPYLYYLSNFLLESGEKVNPETVKRIYTAMEKEDKQARYTPLLKDKLGKWMKTKLPTNKEGKLDIASPEFKLTGLNGKEVSLSDYKGKVIYVDFWASWCGPCRQQFPFSKELHNKLTDKQKKEVVFLYISIDNTEEVWKKAINDLQLEGEHALSPGGWNSLVAKYYQINSIPRYLLIDKKGVVVNDNATRPGEESTLQDILNLLK